MSYQGNVPQFRAAAPDIVNRLRTTDLTLRAIAKEYHVGYHTAVRELRKLMSTREWKRRMRYRLSLRGKGHRFQKGDVSWNKGMKGWFPAGSEANRFKKGVMCGAAAKSHKSIGSITIRRHTFRSRGSGTCRSKRYRWIKVREGGQKTKRFIPYAKWLWEQQHGPVPDGCFVGHADNNSMNDSLENLILVHGCKDNMARLRLRPEVEAKRMKRVRDELFCRHHIERPIRQKLQWEKSMSEQSRIILECQECGADLDAGTEQCPKCGSFNIEQLTITPIPDSEAEGVYVKQAESA